MGIWESYATKADIHGYTKRDAAHKREVQTIHTHRPGSLSEQVVEVFTAEYGYNIESDEAQDNKIEQVVAIIDSDNLDEKTMISDPDEDIELGSLVHWMDNYWLVVERDVNLTIHTKVKLLQCNHLLKWIDPADGQIYEQWCVFEDGTKYLTGEYEDRNFVVTRGDSRISIELARNEHTVKFDRTSRFLIDDDDSVQKLSYILSKPLKVGHTYNGKGTMKFVMQEVTATGDDNHELGIADYYKYYQEDGAVISYDTDDDSNTPDDDSDDAGRKRVWL